MPYAKMFMGKPDSAVQQLNNFLQNDLPSEHKTLSITHSVDKYGTSFLILLVSEE